jgi:hypothetical protein
MNTSLQPFAIGVMSHGTTFDSGEDSTTQQSQQIYDKPYVGYNSKPSVDAEESEIDDEDRESGGVARSYSYEASTHNKLEFRALFRLLINQNREFGHSRFQ